MPRLSGNFGVPFLFRSEVASAPPFSTVLVLCDNRQNPSFRLSLLRHAPHFHNHSATMDILVSATSKDRAVACQVRSEIDARSDQQNTTTFSSSRSSQFVLTHNQ